MKSPIIKTDISTNICFERYEKSRIDKKLKHILEKNGSNINTIKDIKKKLNIDKKESNFKSFRFDNEQVGNKNTLSQKFKIRKMKSKSKSHIKSKIFSERGQLNSEKNDNFILNSISTHQDKPTKKIYTRIFITKNKFKNFEFYSNQDPVILTEKFCQVNQLYEITKFRREDILNQIKQEIDNINNYY